MASIRAFREDDIDPMTRIHQQVFPPDAGPEPPAAYAAYFRDTFLGGPRPDSGFSSLVYEEADGEVSGFLGVIPVRMALAGRPLWGAVCTQFCVDPRRRGLTGLRLLRRYLAGRQDFSISDGANSTTMKLWRWAGGEAVLAGSLHFLRPLRPAQFVLSLLEKRPPLAAAARFQFPARLFDRAVARMPRSYFRLSPPPTRGGLLDADAMVKALPEMAASRDLLPVYEPDPLAWYLRRAEATPGCLRRVLVRDERDKPLGWYLYHRRTDDTGEVLQIVARPDAARRVLDHLLYDAWQAGLVVLDGRVDPALVQELSDCYCMFSRRGPWTVVHARDPAVLHAFHRGDALFSRFDGEWCARFTPLQNPNTSPSPLASRPAHRAVF